jgi:NitT/TauT family transport system permease protein
VAQSEAISVMNKSIKLPGLGSYMASAVERGDNRAAFWAICAMLIVIVASDQLVWRPFLAWADKFKIELTPGSGNAPTSWVYDLLRRSYIFIWLKEQIGRPILGFVINLTHRIPLPKIEMGKQHKTAGHFVRQVAGAVLALAAGYYSLKGLIAGIATVHDHVPPSEWFHLAWLGTLTMLRVFAMTVIATLIWTPVGVWIGFRPRAARFAQPIAQIAASFPVNMTFPFVVGLFVAHHIPMNFGSILLIAMGTQWYLLFNVIAGAMAIPNDLKEAAHTYGLRGWNLWRTLIIPAIFPFWVTGACTAAGGAWNASIVAELAQWGSTKLQADGLGAYIADVTQRGETPLIICSIAIMSLFVVLMNKLLWRRLYGLAERRFRLD